MKDRFLNTKIDPKCEYCEHGRLSPDGETVLCPKKGVVARDFSCRRFRYDIMKRTPRKPPKPRSFSEEDFKL